jgi:ring-1,2-phenylacetyl-CoA epoxidase subunit PaaD
MGGRSSRPGGPAARGADDPASETLPEEPGGGPDQATAPVGCPFCGSTDTEVISPFGSQLLMCQRRCRTCQTYFEALRDDRWEG